jgi:hypothetical protein
MTTTTDFRTVRREQDREDRRATEAARLERERLAGEQRMNLQRLALEAEQARREQDRRDREQAAQVKAEREAAQRAAAAQAKKDRAREKARQAKERRERRIAAVKAVPAWVAEHLDLAAALTVMACSILPALVSQGASLKATGIVHAMGLPGLLLVGLLPVMLECSAWAATAGEAKAMKSGRNPWPYRIAIYTFAGLAAWINWQHGQNVGGRQYGLLLGSVLAASSVVPIVVWQLVQLGRHQEARAALKAARTARRHERAETKKRQELYPDIWHTAQQLRAIAGHGRLSVQEAWQAAYAVHEGAGVDGLPDDLMVLMSSDLLGLRAAAEERLADVLRTLNRARARRLAVSGVASENQSPQSGVSVRHPSAAASAGGGIIPPTHPGNRSLQRAAERARRTASAQAAPSVPPSARPREDTPTRTRKPRPPRPERTLSKGAKNAARETAMASATDAAAAEKKALEDWARETLRTGGTVTWQAVRAEALRRRKETDKKAVEPSRSWSYDRLKAAKATAGMHVVQPGERSA